MGANLLPRHTPFHPDRGLRCGYIQAPVVRRLEQGRVALIDGVDGEAVLRRWVVELEIAAIGFDQETVDGVVDEVDHSAILKGFLGDFLSDRLSDLFYDRSRDHALRARRPWPEHGARLDVDLDRIGDEAVDLESERRARGTAPAGDFIADQ